MFRRILLTIAFLAFGAGVALADSPDIRVDILTSPTTVIPGGAVVTHTVGIMLFNGVDDLTVVSIQSSLYGDISDSDNPQLEATTCALPSTAPRPEGAYQWLCQFQVYVSGSPGDVVDTVTVDLETADGLEIIEVASSTVTITDALGSIRGTVTDSTSGLPIFDIAITAGNLTDSYGGFTDADGSFDIQSLPPGEYRLVSGNLAFWSSEYALEYFDDATTWESADVIIVVGGEATVIDWSLTLGGVISGTVTDSVTGLPIENARISLGGWWIGFSSDSNGAFRAAGLDPGQYTVCYSADGYAPACWSDGQNTTVSVALETEVAGVDVSLVPLGTSSTTQPDDPPETLPLTGSSPSLGLLLFMAVGALSAGVGAVTGLARRTSGWDPEER